jgi:xylan 1,4-beta-xylosidase
MIKIVTKSFLWSTLTFLIVSASFATDYTITVNGNTKQGECPHFWSRCVGTGGAQLCVDKDWKVAAKLGVKDAGFEAFRGHRILSYSNPLIWNGSGTPTYNWTKFDEVYDFLVDTLGTVPIVELSAQPQALQQYQEWSPPKNLTVYQDMIKNVVKHCIERYGMERVSKWYWEVWNEWDYQGFWHYQTEGNRATEQEYYEMYKAAVKGATEAYPEIKIGGPSSTNAGGKIAPFLTYCKNNNVKVDFVTNHNYGTNGDPSPSNDPKGIRDDSRTREDAIKAYGKDLGSMNTEFNSSYSGQGGRDGANLYSMDSHVNAPFVVKCMKLHLDDFLSKRADLPDVMSYWAISDVFDEGSYMVNHNKVPFGQVFGLINYQGVPKATFNAYRMLHKMGTTRIELKSTISSVESDGVDGFATVDSSSSEVAVMIYNFHTTLGGQTAVDNVALNVNNMPLPKGKVQISHFRVDTTHSNAYGVWLKLGKPSNPSADQWSQMRDASNLALLNPVDTIDFDGTAYIKSFTLPRQAVSLILFKTLEKVSVTKSVNNVVSKPAVAFTGTKVINNGKELALSIFSVDGKLIKSFSTTSSEIDIRNITDYRGVCLIRCVSEGNVISSSYIRMN